MKYFILIFNLFLISNISKGQFIDNKLDIEFGVNYQSISGNENYFSNLSVKPYLIGEDIQSTSICIGIDYKLIKLLSLGINLTHSKFDDYDYIGDLHSLYVNRFSFFYIKPSFQINFPRKIIKEVDIIFVLSPMIVFLKSDVSHKYNQLVLDENGDNAYLTDNLGLNEFYYGADVGVKLKMDINCNLGIFLKTGYNQIYTNNLNFEETNISGYYFQAGLGYHLLLNKRYKY
jgi:hypothetical protein